MYIALDTETASLAARHDGDVPIWCASFAWRDETGELLSTALPWDEAKDEILTLLEDETITFLIHNAAFDIRVLRLRGVDIPPGRYIDTMIMSYVWYPGGDHALRDWGIKLGKHKGDFTNFEGGLTQEMLDYSEQDAVICHLVFEDLKPQLETDEQALELFLDVEMPFVEVIIEMEQTGLYIDKERLPEVRRDVCKRSEIAMRRIRELVPYVPGKETIYKKKGYHTVNGVRRYNHCELKPFNPNSGDQLAALLISQGWKPTEFTPTKKPQTGAQILEELDHEKYPIIEPLLEYVSLQKIEGTFLSAFAEKSDDDSILRGSFNQSVTLTGRLSSSKPNLQNIPIRGELGQVCRSLITTPNDSVVSLISGDLSNIEGRVLAYYLNAILGDYRLVQVFIDGVDFHQANADMIGVARQLAKTLLYATMYGAGINKLAKTMGVSVKEAKRVYNLLVEKFPALFELRDIAIQDTKDNDGVLHTLFGRRLVYKNVMSRNSSVRSRSERQIFNALLQGTAADVMKQLTVDSFDLIYDYGGKIAASVHDELLIYCLTENAHGLATELTQLWSTSQYLAPVPITAEFKVGTNWKDLH